MNEWTEEGMGELADAIAECVLHSKVSIEGLATIFATSLALECMHYHDNDYPLARQKAHAMLDDALLELFPTDRN